MSSLNKVILIGRLGKDPETRYFQDGSAVCNFSIATSETWKDKSSGEKREKTEWHNITMFGRVAETAGKYLKKGALVYVSGKLTTEKYTDKSGVERYTTKIIADEMKMLGGKNDNAHSGSDQRESNPPPQPPKQQSRPATAQDDDDLPW